MHAGYKVDQRSIFQREKAIHDADIEVRDWVSLFTFDGMGYLDLGHPGHSG